MSLLSSVSDFFGLDIDTKNIKIVQLRGGRNKTLHRYFSMPVDPKISQSDAPTDLQKLSQVIKKAVGDARVSTINVAVGIPSNKVFSTIVDMDRVSMNDLSKTIQYQADAIIPTPLAESKIDWALLGDSPKDNNKVEVLISSVSNDFVEKRLDLLESIGLNVIAFEPDSLALTRALIASDSLSPTLIVDMGDITSDLVMVMNGSPRVIRTIPVGIDSVIKSAIQGLNIDENQAAQFVYKFGLNKEKLEGQIYNAIVGTVDILVGEIEKTIKFFQARYTDTSIDRIIVTGGASTLPVLPLYIANKFSVNVEIGNSWRNISFPSSMQNELISVSHQFGVATGLAERVE